MVRIDPVVEEPSGERKAGVLQPDLAVGMAGQGCRRSGLGKEDHPALEQIEQQAGASEHNQQYFYDS